MMIKKARNERGTKAVGVLRRRDVLICTGSLGLLAATGCEDDGADPGAGSAGGPGDGAGTGSGAGASGGGAGGTGGSSGGSAGGAGDPADAGALTPPVVTQATSAYEDGSDLVIVPGAASGDPEPVSAVTALTKNGSDALGDLSGDRIAKEPGDVFAWTVTWTNSEGTTTSSGSFTVSDVGLWVDAALGDDSNDGSYGAPFATLAAAVTAASPGDTVNILAGTYPQLVITKSGTVGSPITFRRAPGVARDTVIINGDAPGHDTGKRGGVYARGKSHIVIDGLRVINCSTDGIYFEAFAGSESDRATDITIRNCSIFNTGNAGIYVCGKVMGSSPAKGVYYMSNVLIENNAISQTNEPTGGNECVSVGGGVDGVICRWNYIHDSDQYGIDFKYGVINGEMTDNLIENVEKHGCYVDAASRRCADILIARNIIKGLGNNGIVMTRESQRAYTQGAYPDDNPGDQELENITIEDNFIDGSDLGWTSTNRGIMLYKHTADVDGDGICRNFVIRNNIIRDCAQEGIRLVDYAMAGSTTTVTDNTVWNCGTVVTNTIGATVSGTVTADPGDAPAWTYQET